MDMYIHSITESAFQIAYVKVVIISTLTRNNVFNAIKVVKNVMDLRMKIASIVRRPTIQFTILSKEPIIA